MSPTTSRALAVGSLWHLVEETHYRTLQTAQLVKSADTNWDDVLEEAAFAAGEIILTACGDDEYRDLVKWMYDGYVECYDIDRKWTIKAIEHAAEIWLPTAAGGRSAFKIKMKIDLIAHEWAANRLWVVDHKSGRDLPKQKDLDLDDQFGLYTWGMRKLGHPVFGQIHNAARTYRLKTREMSMEERFLRTPMVRSEAELDCIATEAWRTAKRAYQIKPGQAERFTDPDRCGWRCDYREACLMGRKLGPDYERKFLRDCGYVQDFTRH